MRSIVISCVPLLNPAQQKGLLTLVKDIEARGFRVYVWADNDYDELDKYAVKHIARKSISQKITMYRYYLVSWLLVDKSKWIERLKIWTTPKPAAAAKVEFVTYLKEFARLFSTIKPACFLCWNPYCCRFGVAYDAAKMLGFKTAGMDWGYFPGTFFLDKNGTLASSTIYNTDPLKNCSPKAIQDLTATGKSIFDELKATDLSVYKQAAAQIPEDFLLGDAGSVRVLVLGIGEIDAGAFPADHEERKGLLPFHSSSYNQALDIAGIDKNYRVIFKPHPSHNQFPVDERITANLAIVNGSPGELMEWADVVCCTGSMELAVVIKEKPLITYGAGLLYGKGCSYEITKPDEAKNVIERALSRVDDSFHMKNFLPLLGYLKTEYLYSFINNTNNTVEHILKTDR